MHQQVAEASSNAPLAGRRNSRYVCPSRTHAENSSLIEATPVPLPEGPLPMHLLKVDHRRPDPTRPYVCFEDTPCYPSLDSKTGLLYAA